MGTTSNPTLPSKDSPSRSFTRALAWALLAPLACIGGQGDSTTSASSTTASGSSESNGMTSTSGKTTSAGTGSGTDGTQGTTDTQGTLTQGTASDPTSTEPTSTEPCNFVGCDDDIPPSEYCDYHDELCPEGTKCSFDGELSESACFELEPMPDMLGEPCEPSDNWPGGMDSCGDGLICWEETCLPFCDTEDFSCPSAYLCVWCQECALGVCISECDPLLQDCQEGDTCVPNNETFTCVLDASGDAGAYGDPCEFINGCDPGLTCVDAGYVPECQAASCCSPFCDLDSPTCPDDSLECIPWYEEGQAPPGYEVIGLCGLPQP